MDELWELNDFTQEDVASSAVWSNDTCATTVQAQTLEQAKQSALRYVSARMRTKVEVHTYLSQKGYDSEQIEIVLAFLQTYQYLDDAAYCRAWIHDRIQFHPCGRQKMAFQLSKKVDDHQLVQQSLEMYFSTEQELELAQQAAEQKLRSRIGKSTLHREQLARFLYSRGYSSSIITQVLDILSETLHDTESYD